MDNTALIKELSELIMNDESFLELSQKMDVYCPFEALKISKFEIRHSNFLADILSPTHPHGFGDKILKKFVESILKNKGEDSLALNIHLQDLMDADVRREWNSVDLLIRIPNGDGDQDLVIALEIKVHAQEGKKQLTKYTDLVSAEWPTAKKIYIFLTPEDTSAPTHSDWKQLYFDTVVDAAESALQEDIGSPAARTMLKCYVDMIRRDHMSDQEMEELALKIWAKHQSALEFIIEHQPLHIEDIIKSLHSEDFIAQLNNELLKRTKENIYVERLGSGKRKLNFKILSWKKYHDIYPDPDPAPPLIKAEIAISEKKCAARLVLCPGDQNTRQKIYSVFQEMDVLSKQKETITSEWTRLTSNRIYDRTEMQEIIDNFEKGGEAEKKSIISKLNAKIIKALADDIVKADAALNKAKEDGLVN